MPILLFTIMLSGMGFGLVLPAFLFYAENLGASAVLATAIVGSYSIGQAIATPIWGRMSDRYGRKPMLLLSTFGMGLSYLLLALADNLWALAFARVMTGLLGGNVAVAMAYVADMKLKRVLAISLNDIEGIIEVGEMVLSIPGENDPAIGFPSSVYVTQDGRLLIGDAANGVVRVFTCDGRPIYEFDRVPDLKKMAPQSFAVDGMINPSVQDEHSADPSGIRNQGRLHLVDGYNGRVHMFSPLGRFLGSYPKETRLTGPAGIAVDRVGKRIFVTDPPAGRILVYRYEGD